MSSSQNAVHAARARWVITARVPVVDFAARTAAAVLVAYVPILVAASGHAAAGWAAALVATLVLVALPRLFDAESLACALVPAASLTLSGLVQASSEYMAMGTIGLAFVARSVLDRRARLSDLRTASVPRIVVGLVVVYIAWAAVATAFSIDRRASLIYLVGMTFALAVAFWFVPLALASEAARRRLLITVVAVALTVVGISAVLAVTGPFMVYGAWFGNVLMVEPTLFRAPTYFVYPRAFGPYVDQGAYYTLVNAGLLATFALRSASAGRARAHGLVTAAAVVLTVALLLCYSRAGWTMAIAGGAIWTAVSVWRRRPDWFAGSVTAVFGVVLVALLLNVLGANARFDVQVQRGWPAYVVADKMLSGEALLTYFQPDQTTPNGKGPIQIRGGLSLTERDGLWGASLAAARRRPILGYGPGTDAPAIAAFLVAKHADYKGVSSHSGWLRTLVEMGGPGLLLLLAVWTAVLGLALAAVWRSRALLRDATFVVLVGWAVGFLIDETFQVYLLGGFGVYNLLTGLSLALVAAIPALRRPATAGGAG